MVFDTYVLKFFILLFKNLRWIDSLTSERGAPPVFKSLILGRPVKAEILVERIPLEDIPEDPDQASKWLGKKNELK